MGFAAPFVISAPFPLPTLLPQVVAELEGGLPRAEPTLYTITVPSLPPLTNSLPSEKNPRLYVAALCPSNVPRIHSFAISQTCSPKVEQKDEELMNKDIGWTKEGKRRRKIEPREEEREKG
jgi:hypothetical protein